MKLKVTQKNPKAIKKILERYKNYEVRVGFPSTVKSLTYPDGTQVTKVALDNVEGDPKRRIPARNFMKNAESESIEKSDILFKKGMIKINRDALSMSLLMDAIGIELSNIHKTAIINLKSPPNSPRTIKLKGSSNPLIDTRIMLGALTYSKKKI